MSDGDMRATGPAVSGFVLDPNALIAMEAGELGRLVPRFYSAKEEGVKGFLHPRKQLLEPAAVTYTLPDVTAVWFETFTGAEPTLGFPDFVKGLSCAALGVDLVDLELVKGAVRMLAERVMNGGDLPPLDIQFGLAVKSCYATIMANGESLSWRGLMAFTLGAFWLLGFVLEPTKSVGRKQPSPLEFVQGFIEHYARLGYLPT